VKSSRILVSLVALAGIGCAAGGPATPTGVAGSSSAGSGSGGAGSGGAGAAGTGVAGMAGVAGKIGGMDGAAGAGAAGADGGATDGDAGFDPTMPTLLSQTGLFSNMSTQALASGVYPYTPQYTLWADGATKRRWVYLPPGAMIDDTSSMDFWAYPQGTKLWKEFTVNQNGQDIVIETRMIQKVGVGLNDWYMMAFKWNADHKDAVAVPDGEMSSMGTPHDIPSKNDCTTCHKAMWDNVLGFSALQLSHDIGAAEPTGSVNLAKISQMGWLTTTTADFKLPGTPVEQAALGYLHANCGICHNVNGKAYLTDVDLDLWTHVDQLATVQTTRAYLSMVCDQWPAGPPVTGGGAQPDKFNPITSCAANHATGAPVQGKISKVAKRVTPQDPGTSAMHELMNERGSAFSMSQMPPLATKIVDPTGLGQLDAWINALPLK
jgi:hypothetical protein